MAVELVHHAPGSAARVEQLQAGASKQPIELAADDQTPAAVPPVMLLGIDHRLKLGRVHEEILLPGWLSRIAVRLGSS